MSIYPDPAFVQAIAADLGVSASFIEKDWHAMRIIAALVSVKDPHGMTLVFSGGTSLSKGYGLIQRFSEDLDFKVFLPARYNRQKAREYRQCLIQAIRQGCSDWELADDHIQVADGGRFISCQITYPQNFALSRELRPHIKVEISFKPPLTSYETCSLQSFIVQAQQQPPEVIAIPCVAPAETAADKLSALTWRILAQKQDTRKHDPTLIRHLHDLAVLENLIEHSPDFPALVLKLIEEDTPRAKIPKLPPKELLHEMLDCLASAPIHAQDYENFVLGMSYAVEAERLSFQQALAAVHRIVSLLPRG